MNTCEKAVRRTSDIRFHRLRKHYTVFITDWGSIILYSLQTGEVLYCIHHRQEAFALTASCSFMFCLSAELRPHLLLLDFLRQPAVMRVLHVICQGVTDFGLLCRHTGCAGRSTCPWTPSPFACRKAPLICSQSLSPFRHCQMCRVVPRSFAICTLTVSSCAHAPLPIAC